MAALSIAERLFEAAKAAYSAVIGETVTSAPSSDVAANEGMNTGTYHIYVIYDLLASKGSEDEVTPSVTSAAVLFAALIGSAHCRLGAVGLDQDYLMRIQV